MIVSNMHDTGEFPTLTNPKIRRPKWSNARWASAMVLAFITFVFVLDVVTRPHHGVGELPQVATDVIRANWMIALATLLAAWAYDRVAPKIASRFMTIRDGIRAVERRQAEYARMIVAQAAELTALRHLIESSEHVHAQRLDRVLDELHAMRDQAAGREINQYAEGFNAALDRVDRQMPNRPTGGDGLSVIRLPARQRHGV